ncbi:hypothetical protein [Nitrosomonas communis]|uniref:Uncharacterized protein n=1 Tax=Nitrosomonas communis TaxID=44574 RepID=A0A1I4WY43_9PROT|nr:hypothetical protein [Nitrosomonas communis]SFN18487.1 hypothetical protein SAMN05421863_11261 [Nitrosomonas communis]
MAVLLLLLGAWNDIYAEDAANNESIYDQFKNFKFWFFVFGCGVISILGKIVDHAIQINKIDDTQKIQSFTKKETLLEWFLWFLSASIVGFLGNLVGLFQASAQAAVVIGLGWPTVFAQLKEKYGPKTEN